LAGVFQVPLLFFFITAKLGVIKPPLGQPANLKWLIDERKVQSFKN
jgi:hypothetical protein